MRSIQESISFRQSLLFSLLSRIENNNAQGEYYLTDIVSGAVNKTIPVHGFVLEDGVEASGINTRAELAQASAVNLAPNPSKLDGIGVTLMDPGTAYVDSTVKIGPDTVVHLW